MELFAPLSILFLCFPKLMARVIILCQKWVTQKDLAHRQAAIARYARLAGACYLSLAVVWMIMRLRHH